MGAACSLADSAAHPPSTLIAIRRAPILLDFLYMVTVSLLLNDYLDKLEQSRCASNAAPSQFHLSDYELGPVHVQVRVRQQFSLNRCHTKDFADSSALH